SLFLLIQLLSPHFILFPYTTLFRSPNNITIFSASNADASFPIRFISVLYIIYALLFIYLYNPKLASHATNTRGTPFKKREYSTDGTPTSIVFVSASANPSPT